MFWKESVLPDEAVERVRAASIDELDGWAALVLTAESLADILR